MDKEELYKLAKEYVNIINLLRKEYIDHIHESRNRMYVNIDLFNFLLEQKKFFSLQEKKYKWRSLNWIECDKDRERFTKLVNIKGIRQRRIVINMLPYEELKYLE